MNSGWGGQDVSDPLENNDHRLDELFDGNVFHVPRYQRFYSWEKSQWDDLWNDLINILDEEGRQHYMGTVICKDERRAVRTGEFNPDYREYGIVDGQQRFTTIILLIKAIVRKYETIDKENLSQKAAQKYETIPAEQSKQRFVLDRDIDSSTDGYEVRNKLKLQGDDNKTFKAILRNNTAKAVTDTPSRVRLVEAYKFYERQLEELQESLTPVEFIDKLGHLLATISGLRFMTYTITDPAQATLIFESINDRGKGLSRLDKTKSFLMHQVYLGDDPNDDDQITIDEVQRGFGEIYKLLQSLDTMDRTGGLGEEQIQRYHYVSTIDRSINSSYIKEKTDRRNRNLPSGATVYLGALKWHFNNLRKGSNASIYDSYPHNCLEEIKQYTESLQAYYCHMEEIGAYGRESGYHSGIDWELKKLFALDRLGNFYPLLLTVWNEYTEGNLSDEEMNKILQLIEVASFRVYTTVNRSDAGEPDFYKLANKIGTGERSADWIAEELKNKIRSNQGDFEAVLRDRNAYHGLRYKDLRYLLYSYELYVRKIEGGGGESSIGKAANNAGNDYTLDHIWPSDTSKLNLTPEEEEVHDEVKHSLGNLTLTTGKRNSGWKNQPFSTKRKNNDPEKQDYANSDFAITRKIAREYDTWGDSDIESRLNKLVDYALDRWSLDDEKRRPLADIRPSEVE